MNKHSIHSRIPTVEQGTPARSGNSNQTIVAVLCLAFFPLVYLIGKMVVSILGS